MATLVTKPDLVEFIDLLSGLGKEDLHLDEVDFEELKSSYQGKSIEELDVRKTTGGTILAIRKEEGFKLNPPIETRLGAGESMILIGSFDQLDELKKMYCN